MSAKKVSKILEQSFYQRSTKKVALDLLGKLLCVRHNGKTLKMRILETEAYLGATDRACHTFNHRRTPRTEAMYQDGGHSYIYFIYGMYFCFNVVTRTPDHPEAVLIRGGIIEGVEIKKTNGPGKLCRVLNLTKEQNLLDLTKKSSGVWIEDDGHKIRLSKIKKTPRIGVDYAQEAKDWPLRFHAY